MGAPGGGLAGAAELLLGGLLAGCVIAVVLGRAGALDDDLPVLPAVLALVLAAVALVPLPSVLLPNQRPFFQHLAIYWAVGGGALVLAVLALARWRPRSLERGWTAIAGRAMRVPRVAFVGGAALFAFAAATTIAVACFSRLPNDVDEASQLWHAKILASGRLMLPLDPNIEFFAMDDMVTRGGWYSHFPIGGPAILAVGAALRVLWIVNPHRARGAGAPPLTGRCSAFGAHLTGRRGLRPRLTGTTGIGKRSARSETQPSAKAVSSQQHGVHAAPLRAGACSYCL